MDANTTLAVLQKKKKMMLLTSQKNLFSFATVAKVFTDEAGFGLLAHSLVLRPQNCGVKSSGGSYGISLINAAPTPYRPFPTQKKKKSSLTRTVKLSCTRGVRRAVRGHRDGCFLNCVFHHLVLHVNELYNRRTKVAQELEQIIH